ncbi:ATP-binding protein [Chitinispirillales bacterium ANBcel5]|uniref:ATP-binding protein n=1 Tax=Cellulosispirillum alkaliphilum TaxID=3039283 RepID=UPI002A56CD91|nr:ATP-binding protein [Chitinispirillales bacterium ANBcel5]
MMYSNPQNSYLKANTIIFAQNVCQALEDMAGAPFNVCKETLEEAPFKSTAKMIAYITFSGSIQGHYLLALDDVIAMKVIDIYEEGMSSSQIRDLRSDYGGFIKELLNLSVGQSIVELEKNFGDLTFFPAIVTFGEIEFPDIQSGNIVIEGKSGKVQCCFSLNMANLKIGQKLEEALVDLEKKTSEAKEARRNVNSILQLLPIGLLAIDKSGKVLPGYSKSTNSVVGLDPEQQIVGKELPEVLGTSKECLESWKSWLTLVYDKFGEIPFKDMADLCELNEFVSDRKRNLKIDWLPVEDETDKQLEKLLVVIQDVTKQRELEASMKELNDRHQNNLELISQIINIGPDEVTNFIYDSSQLLTDAQKIVERNNYDRELVNELYRTFHTLKGSSGQFRFKELQQLAHSVEDHLRMFRDKTSAIDTGTVQQIMDSIKDAKGYITRIQDIKSKLGGKDESLKTKAERDPGSVMVNLGTVKEIGFEINKLKEKCKLSPCDQFVIKELDQLYLKALELRKINLSFFISSLESLVKNTVEKVGKKASIVVGNDMAIDIEVMRKVHQCLIHMINNALDHGIESPEERAQNGKMESGLLVLSGLADEKNYRITISDDGRGIDINSVKTKVAEIFNKTEEEMNNMNQSELLGYLFEAGFSTKDRTTEISGRGVGMDFVSHTVKKLNGSVEINTSKGKGTEIVLVIPQAMAQKP